MDRRHPPAAAFDVTLGRRFRSSFSVVVFGGHFLAAATV
jgi:hypothetical protein